MSSNTMDPTAHRPMDVSETAPGTKLPVIAETKNDPPAEALEPRRGEELEDLLTINDIRTLAQKKVPKMYRDYFNDGADDMITLHDNEAAYNRYKIRPRVLIDMSNLDSTTNMFGTKISLPLGFAPAAAHKLAHPDGEAATSRAAAKAGIPMGLSSYSNTPIEEVACEGRGNPYIMHLTIMKDRSKTLQTLRRVESESDQALVTQGFIPSDSVYEMLTSNGWSEAGFKGVILTVDAAVLGQRLNEYRNNFKMPPGVGFPILQFEDSTGAGKEAPVNKGAKGFKSVITAEKDNGQSWESVMPWIKSQTKLQVWVKGIYHPEDVKMAIKYGLDGVVISNHGGRQLDGVPASLDALRDCAPAACDENGKRLIQIAVDGGIRRGSDIFKAIALGAQMVFVGRIPIWGLSVGGEEGVTKAVQILTQEFRQTMALAGCRTVADITPDRLAILSKGRLLKL
ncbi:(S)-2-hydroxy-acid oxidase [Exophiala viscosa]|uniref:(S)-2-hydroxy-acid oxidase n=1 Tax=Exophiala viscosa TaxID=2486360 RepID=UPI00218CA8CA|nr:(S)-2-hydroxy-acid oxidase [Exophiala viscosa]